MVTETYDAKTIEGKWQQAWEAEKSFEIETFPDAADTRPKYYCLCMFPYPSGAIHVGHMRNYAIGDVISRYKRMRGFRVLQPIGWDSFGLPAENAAHQRGIHPRDWTLQNIQQMKTELKRMGVSYDWSREIATCLPEYFRWEQLLFRRFYENGLAYKKSGIVNWCEPCQTVLANEQVQDGMCWRCDSEVIQKQLSQWYLKITQYAEELLQGHDVLKASWPERVIEMQRHWIGKSHGSVIEFPVDGLNESIEVFTTRPDTLFGVSFVTIAAGHPFSDSLCKTTESQKALCDLRITLKNKKPIDDKSKSGFFTGSYATHPLTQKKVPIWVGDFVVMDYGTGAVMGVPAHDERDFEFASQYGLPVVQVITADGQKEGNLEKAFTDSGVLVNSSNFDGLKSDEAKLKIGEALQAKNLGKPTTQYRLRDWGISRQRYWGTPIPIIYCNDCGPVLVDEKDLPLELPYDVSFKNTQGNPLALHPTFKHTLCPKCGKKAERETDTMDTFVESSWYYARFLSPHDTTQPIDKKASDAWLPIDCYIGGIEHACMHLLYARFFHKALRDWGYLSSDEPFAKLITQGMVIKDGAKMSKSKGNVVTPDSIIERFGVDTGRLFCLFAAPPEKDLDWNDKGVEGCYRFLSRVWRLSFQFQDLWKKDLVASETPISEPLLEVQRKAHWMIAKMGEDLENEKFNTAISACMELINTVYGALSENTEAFNSNAGAQIFRHALESTILCLAPFAPHLSEELWEGIGAKGFVSNAMWPSFDPQHLHSETFLLVVQVNGKLRDKLTMPKDLDAEAVKKQVLQSPKVLPFLDGKSVRQFIYVPGRLANVVVA